jgi:hypothetical protein
MLSKSVQYFNAKQKVEPVMHQDGEQRKSEKLEIRV